MGWEMCIRGRFATAAALPEPCSVRSIWVLDRAPVEFDGKSPATARPISDHPIRGRCDRLQALRCRRAVRRNRFNGVFSCESRRFRLSSSMVEQWTFNPLVLGSSPRGGTPRIVLWPRRPSSCDGNGLLELSDGTVTAVPDCPWGDALLTCHGARRPGDDQCSNQIEIAGGDASETRRADNISQLDECR